MSTSDCASADRPKDPKSSLAPPRAIAAKVAQVLVLIFGRGSLRGVNMSAQAEADINSIQTLHCSYSIQHNTNIYIYNYIYIYIHTNITLYIELNNTQHMILRFEKGSNSHRKRVPVRYSRCTALPLCRVQKEANSILRHFGNIMEYLYALH